LFLEARQIIMAPLPSVRKENEMKKIVLVFVLLLTACAPVDRPAETEDTISQEYTYGVTRVVDEEAGVVCWTFKSGYAGGISCLPINQTLLDE